MRNQVGLLEELLDGTERIMQYCDYSVVPEVRMIPLGEVFGGTWVISSCTFGKAAPEGFEVRCLLSDNDHFATRGEAVRAARLRAIRTIDLDEVGARHMSSPRRSIVLPRTR